MSSHNFSHSSPRNYLVIRQPRLPSNPTLRPILPRPPRLVIQGAPSPASERFVVQSHPVVAQTPQSHRLVFHSPAPHRLVVQSTPNNPPPAQATTSHRLLVQSPTPQRLIVQAPAPQRLVTQSPAVTPLFAQSPASILSPSPIEPSAASPRLHVESPLSASLFSSTSGSYANLLSQSCTVTCTDSLSSPASSPPPLSPVRSPVASPSSPSAISYSPPPSPSNLSGAAPPTYRGNFQVSKYGKHPVLVYTIPGQSRCYSFSFHKDKKHSKSYRCVHCQTAGFHVKVDVVDDEFLSDPCMLPHHCIPRKWTTTNVERFLYQRLQEVRKEPKFAETPVRRLWQDLLEAFPEMSHLTLEEVQQLTDEYNGPGYDKRRRRIAKSVEVHDKPRVTLDELPEHLRKTMDGIDFLQFTRPGLYIFYSKETIKKAFENGLVALVADGIHKLPPEALGEHGQLYTIHGVCNGGIDVPLDPTRHPNSNIERFLPENGKIHI